MRESFVYSHFQRALEQIFRRDDPLLELIQEVMYQRELYGTQGDLVHYRDGVLSQRAAALAGGQQTTDPVVLHLQKKHPVRTLRLIAAAMLVAEVSRMDLELAKIEKGKGEKANG